MARLAEHPTVEAVRARGLEASPPVKVLEAQALRAICLEAGAADVGFVSLARTEMDPERSDILRLFPSTRMLISIVCRMNPDAVRSPARNLANHDFHNTGHDVDDVARRITERLSAQGIRAVAPPMAFPMESDRFGSKPWAISLKPLAVAAGMGRVGIHRNVIHPRFGNFILLGSVMVAADVSEESRPIDYNPCLSCKLCVAACPVGAIGSDGAFDFSACYTHNYREFMGGFTDWVETIAESRNAQDYRAKVTDAESSSMWQSLAYGPNYKAAYCLAVCPAGEDVIAPFLVDRKGFLDEVVRPLQDKEETLYVQPNSDAEVYAHKRFPHKKTKRVGSVLRPASILGFIRLMRHGFQRGQSKGLNATYHFQFQGDEPLACTVIIRDQTIEVLDGLQGACDLRVVADSRSWLAMLRKEANVVWLLLTRRIKLKGNPRLLLAFGKCFP